MLKKNSGKTFSLGRQSITLDGKTVSYELKCSVRAKAVRFQIKAESGLTVFIPKRYKPEGLPELFQKHSRWIQEKLAKYCTQPTLKGDLRSGDKLLYLGRAVPLLIRLRRTSTICLKLRKDKIIVELPDQMKDRLDVVLERWYRLQAGYLIKGKVDELASRLGLSYSRLFIRGQKTRWGTCSKKGNLSFNWKLIIAPEPVVDYVIVHELTHLKEMNHGKKFWALVAEHCPRWREHKKWLREHGNLANRPFI